MLRQMPCFYDIVVATKDVMSLVSMVAWISSKSVSSSLQHSKIEGRNNI